MHAFHRFGAIALAACLALIAAACPRPLPTPTVRPAPTPRTGIPPPKIEARAHPVFRLILPSSSADQASRLMALSLRVENIHDIPLSIRPDQVRVELPDGSARFCLDRPRAAALLKRTTLARADLYYLEEEAAQPRGGLTATEKSRLRRQAARQLMANTRVSPGESVEGLVVIDTRRPFATLSDSVVEVIAEPSEPTASGEPLRYPVRVLLGAPIEMD